MRNRSAEMNIDSQNRNFEVMRFLETDRSKREPEELMSPIDAILPEDAFQVDHSEEITSLIDAISNGYPFSPIIDEESTEYANQTMQKQKRRKSEKRIADNRNNDPYIQVGFKEMDEIVMMQKGGSGLKAANAIMSLFGML